MNKRTRAFTLIEVLVSLAIIAVLLAMLIPSMLYVRKQARKTSLLAQINRLQISMQHYVSEYQNAPAVYTHAELKDVSEDITETENAFFALQGGLVYGNDGSPPDITALASDVRGEDGGSTYDVATFGTGSVYTDDSGTSARQGVFYRATESEMQNTTGTIGADNFIPDLVDPVNGQPLLIYQPAPYPTDSNGYARHANNVIPVSWDDSKIDRAGDGLASYGLVWRRLNSDFTAAPGLSSGGVVMDQANNSMLSDVAVGYDGKGYDETNDRGASSNLAWFIMDWTQISSNVYYTGNPNYVRKYDRHKVTKGYWLISAGYDGVYLNYEDNKKSYKRTYHAGHWNWDDPSYPQYSSFEVEREEWFKNRNDRMIFAHRYFASALRVYSKDSIEGRGDKAVKKNNEWNRKDGAFGKRSLGVFTANFDDIILEGGELDGSIE